MKNKYSTLNLIFRVFTDYVKANKKMAFSENSFAILHALALTTTVIFTQNLFEAVTQTANYNFDFWDIALPIVNLILVTISIQIFSGLNNLLFEANSYKNVGIFMSKFQLKLRLLPPIKFESKEFLDDINKAKDCIEYEDFGHLAFICSRLFTHYLVFFVSVSIYLFVLYPLLVFIVLISFVPAILGQLAQIKIFENLEEENAPLKRKYKYYQKTIADKEFYKETRILGAFNFFYNLFKESMFIVTEKSWKTERKISILRLLLNLFSFAGIGVSIFMLFNAVMTGQIQIGAFAAVFVSLTQIFNIMEEVVSRHFSEASESIGKVSNYYNIMDSTEIEGESITPDFTKGIIVENVSFTYPGQKLPSVKNISFEIKNNETVAIVGENGAGKSTLVMLIMGLYTPDTGLVLIGGRDTKKTYPSSIFSVYSAVFQRFGRYKMTLADN